MSKKTILLVDDDEVIRQGLKAIIETETEYNVIDVSSGSGAIAILSARKPQIDAAILDIVMQGHGGSVGDYLRKTPDYKNTVIIYYSGLDKNQFDNKILEFITPVVTTDGNTHANLLIQYNIQSGSWNTLNTSLISSQLINPCRIS